MINNRVTLRSPPSAQRMHSPGIQNHNRTLDINNKHYHITYQNVPLTISHPTIPLSPPKNNINPYHVVERPKLHKNNNILINESQKYQRNNIIPINFNKIQTNDMNNLTNFHHQPTIRQVPRQIRRQQIPNTIRYSQQLIQLRKQLSFLKSNLFKIQNSVSYQQWRNDKNQQIINRQNLRLSFNNTQRTKRQSSNQNNIIKPTKRRQVEELQWQNKQKELLNSLKIQENQRNSEQLEKVDYIFKRLYQLQSQFDKSHVIGPSKDRKRKDFETNETNDQFFETEDLLLSKLTEKTFQLRRIQIKLLPHIMNINYKQQFQESTLSLERFPEQWRIFEAQLNSLISKMFLIIQQFELKLAERQSFNKRNTQTQSFYQLNIGKRSDSLNTDFEINNQSNLNWRRNENSDVKKIQKESKLRQQENQVLKLEYSKIKNKMLEVQQLYSQMQSDFGIKIQQNKKLSQEVQRLQNLLTSQDQKLQLVSAIKDKKQNIEKEYHRIIAQLNKHINQKQTLLTDLKKQLNSNKMLLIERQNTQNQLKQEILKTNQEKQELLYSFKMVNSEVSNEQILQFQNNIRKLTNQLALTLNLQPNNQAEQIITHAISQIKQKQYLSVFQNYKSIAELFDVKVETKDYHKILMEQINLFRNDIKLLFNKVQQVTQENKHLTSENSNLKQQLQGYKIQIINFTNKITQMENIISKQNDKSFIDKSLVGQMKSLNEKMKLKYPKQLFHETGVTKL